MKFSLLLLVTLFLSSNTKDTVDTYDWSMYEMAAKQVNESISKIVDAHLLIKDDLNLKIDLLPQRTKSQLVILHDAAYLEWLVAEDNLGEKEAAKYWEQYNLSENPSRRLMCYEQLEKSSIAYVRKMYNSISECEKSTRTACHLDAIQKQVEFQFNFHACIEDKYGGRYSPIKPNNIPKIKIN